MKPWLRTAFFSTMDFLVQHDSALAPAFVRARAFLSKIESGFDDPICRVRAEWLDRNRSGLKETLAPEYAGLSYGPMIAGSQPTAKVRIPAVNLYEFDHAVVSAASSSVIVGDRVIIERAEGVDPRRCNYAGGQLFSHGQKSAFLVTRPAQHLDAGLFLAGNGSFNYYHWMIEILPRLQFLPQVDARYPRFPLLVSEAIARIPAFRESLAMIAGDRPVVVLEDGALYEVARLVYINAPNICPINLRPGHRMRTSDFFFREASIAFLRDRLGAHAGRAGGSSAKRVFFGRKGERRRYNEDEVYAAFAREGFVRVLMEELSLRDQIELMAGAEIVAGPTGAAWTNVIFCRPGTRCLCWMAEESREFSAYSNLARIAGVDLRYVTYPTGAKSTWDLYAMDYRVDPSAIEKELSTLLGAGHQRARAPALPASAPDSPPAGEQAASAPAAVARGRPSSDARTGFLFHTPELLNHFSCVIDLLPAGSFDLVVCWDAENSREMKVAAERWKARMFTVRDVVSSGKPYRYMVSNHPVMLSGPTALKQLAAKHVRFMYAAGKSGWNMSDWNALYDLILCFGPYHAEQFAKRSDAVMLQMGYPRLDRFFNTTVDRDRLMSRFHCDPAKQTVVWLPTWKALSSVGLFDRQVSSLTAKYNVVVKVHPLMPGDEPGRVAALRQHTFTDVIADASDNLPLYQLADFMLFDYGGPPFAGIYTDKRMVLLNVPNAEKDALTGEDSPDISIRRTIVNIDASDGDISRLLADEDLWAAQKAQRQALRKLYFAPYYGFSAQVAAFALSNLDHILRP